MCWTLIKRHLQTNLEKPSHDSSPSGAIGIGMRSFLWENLWLPRRRLVNVFSMYSWFPRIVYFSQFRIHCLCPTPRAFQVTNYLSMPFVWTAAPKEMLLCLSKDYLKFGIFLWLSHFFKALTSSLEYDCHRPGLSNLLSCVTLVFGLNSDWFSSFPLRVFNLSLCCTLSAVAAWSI